MVKQNQIVQIGMFQIELQETPNCIHKYGFIEDKRGWRNGFTEIRKLGGYRYAIKSIMSDSWSVTNLIDMESFCQYYLRLNGYT